MTTKEASAKAGLDRAYIRRLLESGKLSGRKVGRDWLVDDKSLEYYMANRPRIGRPKRESA